MATDEEHYRGWDQLKNMCRLHENLDLSYAGIELRKSHTSPSFLYNVPSS
jgi:hypothetical protein